ncbi:RNA-directed DNA polymerase, eukaryota, reverse transcriptase zinc-binding domain protein [Tanacetum coccineum]
MSALASSGIEVMIAVPNDQLEAMNDSGRAKKFVQRNLLDIILMAVLTLVSVLYFLTARLKLWKDLLELNAIAGNNPWVLLGDFNIVLKINENTNGMNVRGEGIQEFVRCVESLEMEDINMWDVLHMDSKNEESRACFANFMPYLSSDHCPAVLCMPDVIVQKPRSFRFMNFLAEKNGFRDVVKDNWSVDVEGYAMFKLVKRLKAMKKHMRRFNRQNGNVFEKVKFLQTKLARVQECLDKDPFNSLLREEEMIYASAYREAAIDEERLLKQKTKIKWLKEGDSNSSYFHNVIKGRVSRSRIKVVYDGLGKAYYGDSVPDQFVSYFSNFLGTSDDIIDVDDAGTLFIRRLDIDTSVDLIKPVTDEEINEALFRIDDNKASGPDGYTSKFFKAAWSVVDQDVSVCGLIRISL